MVILILTLIFGLAVLIFSLYSLKRAKRKGGSSKAVTVLKFIVIFETLVYLAVFTYVFIRTLLM